MINKGAKLLKVSLVTPRSWVKPAPNRPPVTPPPFEIDIKVANRVASTPGGHILAASTNTGMNEACKNVGDKKVENRYCFLIIQ